VGSNPTRRTEDGRIVHGDNPTLVDVGERMALIRRLCSFERRGAGTDAERRAGNYLAERLREDGRRAEVEPTYVHPQYALAHAIHCALGIAGSIASIDLPLLGFAIVLFAALSMYLDLNTRLYLIRSLFFRRASQNLVCRGGRPDALARVVLCAHYDAPRTGRVFAPRTVRRAARLQSRIPFPIGFLRIAFWSLAALLPLLGARMAGLDAEWLSVVQLIPTLALVVEVFLLVDIALSDVVPGANDNASGVAAALSVAAELERDRPRNLDVWVLLTGAGWSLHQGIRAFVKAHRKELLRDSTYFVELDTVGLGDVRFETAAGWAVSFPMDARLVELCEALSDADREGEGHYRARALGRGGLPGEAVAARLRRYPAITITCAGELDIAPGARSAADVPDRIDPEALERAHAFSVGLVRLLDREVGRTALV
jgi:Peptidase family M28